MHGIGLVGKKLYLETEEWREKDVCTIHLSDMSGGTCCCNRFTSKPIFFFNLFSVLRVIFGQECYSLSVWAPLEASSSCEPWLVHWAASKSCVVSYQFQEEWVKCLPTWNSFPVILGRGREAHNSFSSLLGSNHQVSCTTQRRGLHSDLSNIMLQQGNTWHSNAMECAIVIRIKYFSGYSWTSLQQGSLICIQVEIFLKIS